MPGSEWVPIQGGVTRVTRLQLGSVALGQNVPRGVQGSAGGQANWVPLFGVPTYLGTGVLSTGATGIWALVRVYFGAHGGLGHRVRS